MNCDPIAPLYPWMEYAVFGRALERRREEFLHETVSARRALALGDGDGRFAAALAKQNPAVEIDCLDTSARMIEQGRARILGSGIARPERVRFFHGDVRTMELPGAGYDIVSAHFFFDLFSTSDVQRMVQRIVPVAKPGALWLVSEFEQPPDGWQRVHAATWLRAMYAFFRITTALKTQRMPAWREPLAEAGFTTKKQRAVRGGLMVSELWSAGESCAAADNLVSCESASE